MKISSPNPEILLANIIHGLLAEEDVDTRILTLSICLVRLKLHHRNEAGVDGKAALDRIVDAIADPAVKKKMGLT